MRGKHGNDSWVLHSDPFPPGHRPLLPAGFPPLLDPKAPWLSQCLDLFSCLHSLLELNTNSPLMSLTAWTTPPNPRLIYPTASPHLHADV